MDEEVVYRLVFGKVVGGLRERKGLSQLELAESAQVTQGTLSRIEAGKLDPDSIVTRRLASALGRTHAELVAVVEHAYGDAQRFAKRVSTKTSGNWFERVLALAGTAGLGAVVDLAVAALLQEQPDRGVRPSRPRGVRPG